MTAILVGTVGCTLSTSEFIFAAGVGVRRQIENLANGRHDAYGAPRDEGWGPHIEGACAEAALAKTLNRWWSGNLGDLEAADVGLLEVRSTRHVAGHLIIHPPNHNQHAFVLAVGSAPSFTFPGWIIGAAAKQQRYWRDPTGTGRYAYFVPQSDLLSMAALDQGGSR